MPITQTDNVNGVITSAQIGTYSSASIGAAASDRIIAVACTATGIAPVSATIDYGSGDTAMSATDIANSATLVSTCIFYLAAPTGTQATIKITYDDDDGDGSLNHIIVYSVTGAAFSQWGTDVSSNLSSDPLTTGLRAIASGAILLASASSTGVSTDHTWTNATEDVDAGTGIFRSTTAIRTTAGSVTITCADGVSQHGALAWIYFTATEISQATLIGLGSLSVRASLNQQISAIFGGSGGLNVNYTVPSNIKNGAVGFGGIGTFSAGTLLRSQGIIRFGGAGALSAGTLLRSQGLVRFGGAGNLSVNAIRIIEEPPPSILVESSQIGYGSLFQINQGGSPEDWLTLAETKSLTLPPLERDVISAGHECAPEEDKEYLPGLVDGGEISVTLNFTFAHYQLLLAELEETTIRQRRIVFPDGSWFTFDAWLLSLENPIGVGDLISSTAKFKLSGELGILNSYRTDAFQDDAFQNDAFQVI